MYKCLFSCLCIGVHYLTHYLLHWTQLSFTLPHPRHLLSPGDSCCACGVHQFFLKNMCGQIKFPQTEVIIIIIFFFQKQLRGVLMNKASVLVSCGSQPDGLNPKV